MAEAPIDFFYSDGLITLTNGSDIATGQFTSWDPAVLPFDFLDAGGARNVVKEVISATELRLAMPWQGATLTNAPYVITRWIKHTDPRVYGVRVSEYLTRLREPLVGDDDVTEPMLAPELARALSNVVATRAALKALNVNRAKAAFLSESGREGTFVLRTGAPPITDTREGLYVVSNTAGYYWARVFEGPMFVEWFGAVGDDAADNQPAYDGAVAVLLQRGGGELHWGPGIFRQSGTIQVGGTGIVVSGSGRNATVLRNVSATHPTLKVTSGSNNITIQDFTLDRTVAGVAADPANSIPGGHGIDFAQGGAAEGFVYRINSKGNYHGVALGGCGYSIAEDIFCERNWGNGLDITNSNAFTTCQWYIRNVLCQLNAGDAVRIQSVATEPVGGHMALGELAGVRTFGNSGRGLAVIGNPTVGVYSIRAKDCFFGEDGMDEIYLDTYGNLHTFDDCFVELGGTSPTGPNYNTPATHNSWGVYITPNTPDVSFHGGKINGASNAGVYSLCPNNGKVSFDGTWITNNGVGPAEGPAYNSAIINVGGSMKLIGVTAYGQQYGLYNASTGGDQIVGCDFQGNSVAAIEGNQTGNVTAGNKL